MYLIFKDNMDQAKDFAAEPSFPLSARLVAKNIESLI